MAEEGAVVITTREKLMEHLAQGFLVNAVIHHAESMEPSIAAFANARKTYMEAMKQIAAARDAAIAAGGGGSAMAPLAASAAARAAADANYEAMKKAAQGAMDSARAVARASFPSVVLEENEVEISTGVTNGITVSRINGIKLESGAASITMGPAGITLKFGPSQITLSPAGIQIDAGPGLITQKASLVNAP